jgi:hypothetical protein
MPNQDFQFKVKTLIIDNLASNQVHILDWLLLKSPKLIDLQIKQVGFESYEFELR